jgi:hypothetical protein
MNSYLVLGKFWDTLGVHIPRRYLYSGLGYLNYSSLAARRVGQLGVRNSPPGANYPGGRLAGVNALDVPAKHGWVTWREGGWSLHGTRWVQ